MYIGNGKYCYANSTSMLLDSIGEKVPTEKIEVLTGMGIGATYINDLLFLDSTLPDLGISKALRLLGFTFKEHFEESPEGVPFKQLKEILKKSKVIAGPLDLGYFTHWPNYKYLHGADHYVLIYDLDEQNVYFHDPAGYPYVSLPRDLFAKAWKADNIAYKRGHYRYWHSAKRQNTVSEMEVYNSAILSFQNLYREREGSPYLTSSEAIQKFAAVFKKDHVPDQIIGHVTHFLFQLGATRANDFAYFFKDRNPELAANKTEQAKLLGKCHVLATEQAWKEVSETLEQLASVEDSFRCKLLSV